MDNLYTNPEMSLKRTKARRIVAELFDFYMENPNCLPIDWQNRIENDKIETIVIDFIAGMTDRYAIAIYEKI